MLDFKMWQFSQIRCQLSEFVFVWFIFQYCILFCSYQSLTFPSCEKDIYIFFDWNSFVARWVYTFQFRFQFSSVWLWFIKPFASIESIRSRFSHHFRSFLSFANLSPHTSISLTFYLGGQKSNRNSIYSFDSSHV